MSKIGVLPLRSYYETVESQTAHFGANLHRYGAAVLSAMTIVSLIACPLTFCIDCDYPNPWGHVTVRGEIPVSFLLLIAPFLAGALPMRRGWLVPVVVVLAVVSTQFLGGVAWWSLRENEGPLILLLGLPLTAACFGVGRLIRAVVNSIRPRTA